MEYIIGFFLGCVFMLALGIWMNEREKKRKRQAPPINPLFYVTDEMSQYKSEQYKITAEDIMNLWGSIDPKYRVKSLPEQLQSAIERDDFEEAARIRDLIKKA